MSDLDDLISKLTEERQRAVSAEQARAEKDRQAEHARAQKRALVVDEWEHARSLIRSLVDNANERLSAADITLRFTKDAESPYNQIVAIDFIAVDPASKGVKRTAYVKLEVYDDGAIFTLLQEGGTMKRGAPLDPMVAADFGATEFGELTTRLLKFVTAD